MHHQQLLILLAALILTALFVAAVVWNVRYERKTRARQNSELDQISRFTFDRQSSMEDLQLTRLRLEGFRKTESLVGFTAMRAEQLSVHLNDRPSCVFDPPVPIKAYPMTPAGRRAMHRDQKKNKLLKKKLGLDKIEPPF